MKVARSSCHLGECDRKLMSKLNMDTRTIGSWQCELVAMYMTWWMCRDMDDSTSLDDMSFETPIGAQRGSSNSVNLSVATTDSSSSSGCELSKTKVSYCLHSLMTCGCGRRTSVQHFLNISCH